MKEFIKNNLKLILAFTLGILVSGGVVYAASTIAASTVTYDNTQSGLTATNAQAALDELDSRADTLNSNLATANSNLSTCNTNLTNKTNDYNTCSSNLTTANSNLSTCQSNLSTKTSDYNTCISKLNNHDLSEMKLLGYQTNSAKTIVANSNGVCILRNGKMNCFKKNNWAVEKNHIQQVFSDVSCDVSSNVVYCFTSGFYCYGDSDGNVGCRDHSDDLDCTVYSNGSVNCG